MYYNTCPDCGANLDPGEQCDCEGKIESAGVSTEPEWTLPIKVRKAPTKSSAERRTRRSRNTGRSRTKK